MSLARRTAVADTPSKTRRSSGDKRTQRVKRGTKATSRTPDQENYQETGEATAAHRTVLLRELAGLLTLGLGAIVVLSLLSYDGVTPSVNWAGPTGFVFARILVGALGLCAYSLPLILLVGAASLHVHRRKRLHLLEVLGFLGTLASLSLLLDLQFPGFRLPRAHGTVLPGGGALGNGLNHLLVPLLSRPGTWVVGVTALLLSARLGFGVRLLPLAGGLAGIGRGIGGRVLGLTGLVLGRTWDTCRGFCKGVGLGLSDAWHDWREERELKREERRWEREERLAECEEQEFDVEMGLSAECEGPEGTLVDSVRLDGPQLVSGRRAGAPSDDAVRLDSEGLDSLGADSLGLDSLGVDSVGLDSARTDRPLRGSDGSEVLSSTTTRRRQSRVRRPVGPLEQSDSSTAPQNEEARETRSEVTGIQIIEDEEASLPKDSMCGATAAGIVHAEIRPKARPKAELQVVEVDEVDEAAGLPDSPETAATLAPPLPGKTPAETEDAVDVLEGEEADSVVTDELPPEVNAALAAANDWSRRRALVTPAAPFALPDLEVLSDPPSGSSGVDDEALEDLAERLEATLRQFRVDGEVVNIVPGPVVTMFEYRPAPGIKVSKIAGLGDDLAMALKATKVRIVAPIPGKGAVGIEIPSAKRETVYLRELMGSRSFQESRMSLPLALGKGIDGSPVVQDMAKMPHILMAGTTGSGKSVCVNTVILSLLYRMTPEQVRLILVDPKMLEFSAYEDIPHLLVPVVTQPGKAAVALGWAVQEMQRRYTVLSSMNTRNLVKYNAKAEALKEEWEAWDANCLAGDPSDPPDCGRAMGEDTIAFRSKGGIPAGPPETMPYIVIIIDELSDLMMVARKEVETNIARLAQKARACGIHLLLATQRPSTDVVTGLIKANFPTRMSFRVSSGIDSRTVLDAIGAENLLGMGDGLLLPSGSSDLIRVHGAFVSEEEIAEVVDFLKAQGEPQYVEHVLKVPENDDGGGPEGSGNSVYDQAVDIVASAGKASTSLLQRKMGIGYNRAARIMDQLEENGVIGPQDGARPREVYVEPYET